MENFFLPLNFHSFKCNVKVELQQDWVRNPSGLVTKIPQSIHEISMNSFMFCLIAKCSGFRRAGFMPQCLSRGIYLYVIANLIGHCSSLLDDAVCQTPLHQQPH